MQRRGSAEVMCVPLPLLFISECIHHDEDDHVCQAVSWPLPLAHQIMPRCSTLSSSLGATQPTFPERLLDLQGQVTMNPLLWLSVDDQDIRYQRI